MNAICKNCGRTIWLYDDYWRHYDTEFRRCDVTKPAVAEPSDQGSGPTA